jgi:hypothetical protein
MACLSFPRVAQVLRFPRPRNRDNALPLGGSFRSANLPIRKALLAEDRDFLRPLVQAVLQELSWTQLRSACSRGQGRARNVSRLERAR